MLSARLVGRAAASSRVLGRGGGLARSLSAGPVFHYQELFDLAPDKKTEYVKLTGNGVSVVDLGGTKFLKVEPEALRLLKLAAGVGQPMAAACWGEILLRGRYGLPVNRPEAERLLRLACDEQPNARVVLGFELIGGPEAERRSPAVEKEGTGLLFDAVGEEGELGGRAAFALGLAYFLGRGVPRDVNEARRWHKRSVEIGGGGPWYADTKGERWQADLEQAEAEAQAAEEAAENAKSATETTQPEKVD